MLLAGKVSIGKRGIAALFFIFVSFALVLLGADRIVSGYLLTLGPIGAVLAGAFYTLGATSPFAIVVVLELMSRGNPLAVAILASLSATVVDCFLFAAFKDVLEANTKQLVSVLHSRFQRFSAVFPFVGFFVFALPLPDELGLALVEFTTIDFQKLGAMVFCAKFLTLVLAWGALVAV